MKIDMMKKLFGVLVMPITLVVAGCDSISPGRPEIAEQSQPLNQGGTPRLQPGDKIKVTVYGEDKLSGDYEIDPGGFVSLPLAGTIQAVGLTKQELEQFLAKKFRGDYLKIPKITVDIAAFRPFYVLGEVEKPGEYPYRSGLNVFSAIAVAGGNTYRASRSKVLIQRAGEQSFQEYPLSPTIPVYPGDTIRLPERYF